MAVYPGRPIRPARVNPAGVLQTACRVKEAIQLFAHARHPLLYHSIRVQLKVHLAHTVRVSVTLGRGFAVGLKGQRPTAPEVAGG